MVVRRKLVDARFLEPSVPATHAPSFEVDPQVRFIPVNDLVNLAGSGSGFTIIGAGKTAMDACAWLLEQGVDPGAIRWIRPRDAWLLDRKFQQPLTLLPALIEGVSFYLEAAAEAESRPDLFRRLEDCGQLVRLDPRITPAMFRSATVSDTELGALRSIEHVIRLGLVRRRVPAPSPSPVIPYPRTAARSTSTAPPRACRSRRPVRSSNQGASHSS